MKKMIIPNRPLIFFQKKPALFQKPIFEDFEFEDFEDVDEF